MDESTPTPDRRDPEEPGVRGSGDPPSAGAVGPIAGLESIGGAVEFLTLGLSVAVSLVGRRTARVPASTAGWAPVPCSPWWGWPSGSPPPCS